MDQGLKERLIGAAVLVALGVWLIPWVLDGRDEQSEPDATALRLPAPEEPLPVRTEMIRVGAQDDAVQEPAQEPTQEPTFRAAVAERPPEDSAAAEQPPPAVADAAAEPEPRVAAAQEERQPVAATPPPPAAPAATAPSRPAAAAAEAGDWVVQLGSFGEEENARRLAQRVSSVGYKPSISNHRSNGRVLYRVRVGAFDSKAKADATASSLSAHGFVAQVVAAD
jgi:DedD protein